MTSIILSLFLFAASILCFAAIFCSQEDRINKLCCGLGFLFFSLLVFTDGYYDIKHVHISEGYKQGQIDAINGHIKYQRDLDTVYRVIH